LVAPSLKVSVFAGTTGGSTNVNVPSPSACKCWPTVPSDIPKSKILVIDDPPPDIVINEKEPAPVVLNT